MAEPTIQQRLTAEAVGTFVLVLFGCGAITYATEVGAPSTITTIGLAFGLAVLVMAYAFGRVSGAHFNPAVSVGAALSGRMAWPRVGLYVLEQLVGAVAAALALFLLMHGFEGWDANGNMGQNGFGDEHNGYAWWAAFLLELLMTAIFVSVILAVTDERNEHPALAPLAIGLTLAGIHFVAIPATGTSVNPARSIGPALFAGGDAILQLWLFILAPTIGAAVAGVVYPLLFDRASAPIPGSGFSIPWPRPAVVPGPDQYQQQWNQEAGATGTTGYAAQASVGTPIIQNGWQWDPVGQQWHPVGQSPEQWRAQQAAQEQAAAQAQQPAEQGAPEQQRWPESEPGDGGTQIRPPH